MPLLVWDKGKDKSKSIVNSHGGFRDAKDCLQHIDHFTEWGGHSWAYLTQYALSKVETLQNKRVLEIGFRFGKMTSLFALLGAEVTGLETDASVIPKAQQEAATWGVSSRVSFFHYDGDLSHCSVLKGKTFDIIFSKSVLVLLCDGLPRYLHALDELLAVQGRYIFLENAYGGRIFALIRYIREKELRHPVNREYFTRFHLRAISDVFGIQEVKKSYLPPIYLIMGCKKDRLTLQNYDD